MRFFGDPRFLSRPLEIFGNLVTLIPGTERFRKFGDFSDIFDF